MKKDEIAIYTYTLWLLLVSNEKCEYNSVKCESMLPLVFSPWSLNIFISKRPTIISPIAKKILPQSGLITTFIVNKYALTVFGQ